MYDLGLSAILWEIISSYAWWIVCNVLCIPGLSANSQGNSHQGSWSSINDVNYTGCVCYPNPISVTHIPGMYVYKTVIHTFHRLWSADIVGTCITQVNENITITSTRIKVSVRWTGS